MNGLHMLGGVKKKKSENMNKSVEELEAWHKIQTQYAKDLRDPKKFVAIFLGNKYQGIFPEKDMLYAMAVEKWRGYVSINIKKFSAMHIPPELQERERIFMITDTEINELEPSDFVWSPAVHATDTGREINEEHGGCAGYKIIKTTNISEILE